MSTFRASVLTPVVVLLSACASLGVQTFVAIDFDRSAWEAAAAGTITTDTFSSEIAQSDTLNLDSGVTSQASGAIGSPNHRVTLGQFDLLLRPSSSVSDGYVSVVLTFPTEIYAWGADFFSIGGSREVGPTGDFDSGTQHYILRDLFTAENGGAALDQGFFGIVSDTPFTQIILEATGTSTNDSFKVDNMSFAAVPEPSGFLLTSLGLGLLPLVRSRRRS